MVLRNRKRPDRALKRTDDLLGGRLSITWIILLCIYGYPLRAQSFREWKSPHPNYEVTIRYRDDYPVQLSLPLSKQRADLAAIVEKSEGGGDDDRLVVVDEEREEEDAIVITCLVRNFTASGSSNFNPSHNKV